MNSKIHLTRSHQPRSISEHFLIWYATFLPTDNRLLQLNLYIYIYHKFLPNSLDVSRAIGARYCPLFLKHLLYPATALSWEVTCTTFPFLSINYVKA